MTKRELKIKQIEKITNLYSKASVLLWNCQKLTQKRIKKNLKPFKVSLKPLEKLGSKLLNIILKELKKTGLKI